MNRTHTYPSLVHRCVAYLMLLLLPLYAIESDSFTYYMPVAEDLADNLIKSIPPDIYTFEENTAPTPNVGNSSSLLSRPVVYPLYLPVDYTEDFQTVFCEWPLVALDADSFTKGLKTSLQLYYCVLLI